MYVSLSNTPADEKGAVVDCDRDAMRGELSLAGNEADVLIVGGGPVGITLALDLASRGVEVMVVERRPEGWPLA